MSIHRTLVLTSVFSSAVVVTLTACTAGVKGGAHQREDAGADGAECDVCPSGSPCTSGAQCLSSVCFAGVCAPGGCDDGVLDGTETDLDCGGDACPPCDVGHTCHEEGDCAGGLCRDARCVPPTCDDQQPNGSETDLDCGGLCAPCQDGHRCLVHADCAGGLCDAATRTCRPSSCTDSVRNGEETGIDCGGTCPPCANGGGCQRDSDCVSTFCAQIVGRCYDATCFNGRRDAGELGIDCGGDCLGCALGLYCESDTDCDSHYCDLNNLVCTAATVAWVASDWTPCTAPCDGGSHERSIECQRTSDAGTEVVSPTLCADLDELEPVEACNTEICSYSWVAGQWSPCSASCDGGTWNRDSSCVLDADGTVVSDTLCADQAKPVGSDDCNTQPCCTPNCSGHNCGSDGCGGSCGSCSQGSCYSGHCGEEWHPTINDSVPCSEYCFWGWGQECCGGTCIGDCSVRQDPNTCFCVTYTSG